MEEKMFFCEIIESYETMPTFSILSSKIGIIFKLMVWDVRVFCLIIMI